MNHSAVQDVKITAQDVAAFSRAIAQEISEESATKTYFGLRPCDKSALAETYAKKAAEKFNVMLSVYQSDEGQRAIFDEKITSNLEYERMFHGS